MDEQAQPPAAADSDYAAPRIELLGRIGELTAGFLVRNASDNQSAIGTVV